MTDPIKSAAQRRVAGLRAQAEEQAPPPAEPVAATAPVAAEEEVEVEVTPDAPEVPEVPAEPKYKAGDKVRSKDPARMPGTVVGEALAACPDYEIETADGGRYIESESQMEPDEAPMEEPMTDETVVPGALATALGLSVGATVGQCAAAAKVQGEALASVRAELDGERAEARSAACRAAGMHEDLVDVLSPTIARGEGQTWDQAVAAHKASKPSAYAKPESTAAAAPVKPEPARAQTPPRQPVPAGMAAGEQTSAPNVGAAGGPVSFNLGVSVRPALG